MTESEAREKWCPMVRMDGCEEVPNSFNRVHAMDGSDLAQALCVASDCMMWRWAAETEFVGSITTINISSTNGYCGLAK